MLVGEHCEGIVLLKYKVLRHSTELLWCKLKFVIWVTVTDQVKFLNHNCCILLHFTLNLRRHLGDSALKLASASPASDCSSVPSIEPQQQLGHVLKGLENQSGIVKNNQTKNSGSKNDYLVESFPQSGSVYGHTGICQDDEAGVEGHWSCWATKLLSHQVMSTKEQPPWASPETGGRSLCILTAFVSVFLFPLMFLWVAWCLKVSFETY